MIKQLSKMIVVTSACVALLVHTAFSAAPQKISDLKIELHPKMTPALQKVDEDLRDAVQTLEKKFVDAGVIYEDPALTSYVNSLLTPTDMGVPESDFKFNIKVLKLPDENAFAFPSGNIYVNAGIIPLTKNADELRFVLAHEAMHVIGRHVVFHNKSYREQTTFVKLLDIAVVPAASIVNVTTDFQYGNLISNIASLTGTAAGLFYVASVQGYGRSMEVEADQFGCKVMDQMGKDMSAPVSFFKSFKRFHDKYMGMEFTHFASSHEAAQDRVKRAESWEPQGKTVSELPMDPDYIKATFSVRLDVAELNIKLGRIHRALDSLKFLDEFEPGNAKTQYLQGEAYRRLAEDPKLSKQELVRKEWLALAKSGEAKMKEEWQVKLNQYFKKSIELDPAFAPPHRGLAMHYDLMENWSMAKKYYESYLNLAPQAPDIRFIKAKIKSLASKEAEQLELQISQPKKKG